MPDSKEQASLQGPLQQYLQYLAVERALAENTLDSYRRDLEKYCAYLGAAAVKNPGDIKQQDIRNFAVYLAEPSPAGAGLSARSVARTLVAVRGLHRFWVREKISEQDPAASIQPPGVGLRLPKAISVDEVTALLEASNIQTAAGLRDRAMLEFLYSTGARISEVIAVDLDDLSPAVTDSSKNQQGQGAAGVRLFGKGSKERIVPVGSYASQAISDYLVRARPALAQKGKGTPALFLNARGGRLTRQGAWLILKKAAQAAQLTSQLSPHTLRHSYATHLLEGGADIRVVQELLGHSSVTTTQIYTKITADTLREVFAATHPRAR